MLAVAVTATNPRLIEFRVEVDLGRWPVVVRRFTVSVSWCMDGIAVAAVSTKDRKNGSAGASDGNRLVGRHEFTPVARLNEVLVPVSMPRPSLPRAQGPYQENNLERPSRTKDSVRARVAE